MLYEVITDSVFIKDDFGIYLDTVINYSHDHYTWYDRITSYNVCYTKLLRYITKGFMISVEVNIPQTTAKTTSDLSDIRRFSQSIFYNEQTIKP